MLSFEAEAFVLRGTNRYEVKVTVTNESTNVDAENVKVSVYTENVQLLNSTTIKKIAAESSESVVVAGTTEAAMDEGTKLQVFVEGVETSQWITVSLTDNLTTAIETVKAQMGENTRIFTLGGQQVHQVQKGSVYLINGKKVMVK